MRKCRRQNHSRSKGKKSASQLCMLEERQEHWFNRTEEARVGEGDWGRGVADLG